MKRVISLLLVMAIVFSFAACSSENEENKEEKYGVDIAYFLNVGKFDTAEFSLGTPPSDIDKTIKEHNDSHMGGDGHSEGTILVEGYDYNCYETPEFFYYYNTDKKAKGISYIVAYNEMYGFATQETGKYTIKTALESLGLNVSESAAQENDFFAMPVSIPDCIKLSVENGDNVLEFFFENDLLIFAVIRNKDNWSY